MSEKKDEGLTLSPARAVRMRETGKQLEALNENITARLALLTEDEVSVLHSIKSKLNNGLDARLKEAADTVGGFVW